MRIALLLLLLMIGCTVGSCVKNSYQPPRLSASLYVPYTALPGEEIKMTAEVKGMPYYYHWDFGDGSSSSQMTGFHTYTRKGNYIVTYTVYNYDRTDSASERCLILVGTPYLSKIVVKTMPFTNPQTGLYWQGRYAHPSPYFIIAKEDTLSYTAFDTPYKKEVRADSLPLTYVLNGPFPIGGQYEYSVYLYNKSFNADFKDEFMDYEFKFKGIPSLTSPFIHTDAHYQIEYYFDWL